VCECVCVLCPGSLHGIAVNENVTERII